MAQLRLGEAYEAGIGVERDYERAARLYRQAAAFQSGTTYVYSPPVGREKSGRVIPVRTGADQPGLAQAKLRLAKLLLSGLGVEPDREEALELLREAAAAGSNDAKTILEDMRPSGAAKPREQVEREGGASTSCSSGCSARQTASRPLSFPSEQNRLN